MITNFKIFEKLEPLGNFWLFPTDKRFEKAVLSVPELSEKWNEIRNIFLKYNETVYDWLSKRNNSASPIINPNYIFLADHYNNNRNFSGWNDFSLHAFNALNELWNYRGPIGISDEEYEFAWMQSNANKYNI